MTPDGTAPVPAGWRFRLDPRTRWFEDGRVLLSPTGRLVRLSAGGPAAVADLLQGRGSEAARLLGRRLTEASAVHPLPPPRRADDVTVVVPVLDRADALRECLLRVDADVLVVDDGSRDPATVQRVCQEVGARYVHRHNGGPAAARNTAIPLLDKDVVCFLDSDCLPPPGWLEALRGHLEDPAVGAVAPRVRGGHRSPLDLGPHPALVRPGGSVPYVPTACLLVRRSALSGQGFDEDLRYGEDVDLVWRLVDAGWQVRYVPEVVVEHAEPSRLRDRLVRRFRYGTSAAPLSTRHPGRLSHLVVSPLPTAAVGLALTSRPHLLAVPAAVTAWRVHGRLPSAVAAPVTAHALVSAAAGLGQALALTGPVGWLLATRQRKVAALLALPFLLEWHDRGRPGGPVRYLARALADQAAYGAGVLAGCVRHRTAGPLVPRLHRAVQASGALKGSAGAGGPPTHVERRQQHAGGEAGAGALTGPDPQVQQWL